jgi:transposase
LSPVHPAAAAIDVGATIHVAAVGPDRDKEPVRTFQTFTDDLHRLADWFARCGIKTIVMESTGVYWIPVYDILEQRGFEVLVVNARDAKHVPGRKTDVSDAQWLQRLHEYGLLRASFRPQAEMAALRAYLRQRERLDATNGFLVGRVWLRQSDHIMAIIDCKLPDPSQDLSFREKR